MAASLRVQATGNNGSGATVSGTLTGVVAGDLLVTSFRERDGVSITGVSDTVNGAWTVAKTVTPNAGRAAIYYFENSAAGNPVVTITFSGSNQPSDANFQAWIGCATSGALDATNGVNNGSGTAHSHGAITPSASALLITALASGGDHGGITVPSGFTALTIDGSANTNKQSYAYKTGHTGAITPSATSVNSTTTDAVVASFLELSAGGGPVGTATQDRPPRSSRMLVTQRTALNSPAVPAAAASPFTASSHWILPPRSSRMLTTQRSALNSPAVQQLPDPPFTTTATHWTLPPRSMRMLVTQRTATARPDVPVVAGAAPFAASISDWSLPPRRFKAPIEQKTHLFWYVVDDTVPFTTTIDAPPRRFKVPVEQRTWLQSPAVPFVAPTAIVGQSWDALPPRSARLHVESRTFLFSFFAEPEPSTAVPFTSTIDAPPRRFKVAVEQRTWLQSPAVPYVAPVAAPFQWSVQELPPVPAQRSRPIVTWTSGSLLQTTLYVAPAPPPVAQWTALPPFVRVIPMSRLTMLAWPFLGEPIPDPIVPVVTGNLWTDITRRRGRSLYDL